ncbi:MAG: hypothetical protein HY711_09060, partial [Candidatus Melainabacteria bacterium]|nr:hypothetical protein [Candidatus Melainabacteria bacterium]
GAASAGASAGASAISPTYHQHYGHVAPGAFLPKSSGPGYYKAVDPGVPAKGSGGSGYYKARTPGSDYYSTNTNTGAAPGAPPPQYTGASAKDLKALGREPRLNDRPEEAQAPDAPTPVVVSQSTTQDLSLPEDEFSYRYSNKKKGFRAPPIVRGPLNKVGGMTGVRF